jgi:mono/diheme cytochrome c family protein
MTPSSPAASLANGRSIYESGRDSQGKKIVAKPPTIYPSCAACHRIDGSGGVHFAGGAVSADLRHKAMVIDQKQRKMRPYTLALIERAVSIGIDDNGKPLDAVMPHWKLSARDLHDVAFYVFTKLK